MATHSIEIAETARRCRLDSCGTGRGKQGRRAEHRAVQAGNPVDSGRLKLVSQRPTEWQPKRQAVRQPQGTALDPVEIVSIDLDVQVQQQRAIMVASTDSMLLGRESMRDDQRLSRGTSAITESRELIVHCEIARLPRLRLIAWFCLLKHWRRSRWFK